MQYVVFSVWCCWFVCVSCCCLLLLLLVVCLPVLSLSSWKRDRKTEGSLKQWVFSCLCVYGSDSFSVCCCVFRAVCGVLRCQVAWLDACTENVEFERLYSLTSSSLVHRKANEDRVFSSFDLLVPFTSTMRRNRDSRSVRI